MAVIVDVSDLTTTAVRRLLRDAIHQNALNAMPASRRAKAMKEMAQPEDDEDDENDAKVEINRQGVNPNLPSVTEDDLPRGIKLSKYKGRKHGKVS
jgi:hypothetical protein